MHRAALLALCVVLAGCSGPFGGPSPTTSGATDQLATTDRPATVGTATSTATPARSPTATASPSPPGRIEVVLGSLPLNATAVWHRVLALHGLDPAEIPAPRIVVESGDAATLHDVEMRAVDDRFGHLLGVNERVPDGVTLSTPGGHVDGGRVVLEVAGGDTRQEIEQVLVHEFVHVVQTETVGVDHLPDAVREGAAVYVTDAYASEYMDGVDPGAQRRAAYETAGPNAWKTVKATYYFGYRYVATRVDSPRNLSAVYGDLPTTDEQVLHGLDPAAEPPRPLTVRAAGDGWDRPGTVGEMLLRVALTETTTESRAAAAATGWDNDTLLSRNGSDDYVWVLRMDDPGNASDLAGVLREHVTALARTEDPIQRPINLSYRVVRVSETTLALVVGTRSFVGNVTVHGSDGTVTVSGATLLRDLATDPSSPVEPYGGGRDNVRLTSVEDAVRYLSEHDGNVPFGFG